MTTIKPKSSDPKNVVFLFSAIHLFLICAPSFLLSLTYNLQKDIGLPLMLDADGITTLATPGLAKDFYDFAMMWCLFIGFGHSRIYLDGAINQPLMVFLGACIKFGSCAMCLRWYLAEHAKIGLIFIVCIPDLILGLYYLKVWLEMGAVLASGTNKGKIQ